MQNIYKITLKSGLERKVSREESEGKNVIGLWNWSLGRSTDIVIDFNECCVLSSEIAMIEKPVSFSVYPKGEDHFEEEAKDNRENVQEPGNLAAEPYDYNCYE